MTTADDLRRDHPGIDWNEPVRISIPGYGSWWVCRLCIALRGVSAQDLIHERAEFAWPNRQEAVDHVGSEHP